MAEDVHDVCASLTDLQLKAVADKCQHEHLARINEASDEAAHLQREYWGALEEVEALIGFHISDKRRLDVGNFSSIAEAKVRYSYFAKDLLKKAHS
jgi:hypothetical protein